MKKMIQDKNNQLAELRAKLAKYEWLEYVLMYVCVIID